MSASCENSPLAMLVTLADQLRLRFEEAAASVGLTPAQAEIITKIEGQTRMGDLAQQKVCDPSSVTTMVRRLERDGVVVRIIDPNDARARLVQLTPNGRQLRERFLERVGDGAAVIDALSDKQRAALAGLFAGRYADL
jgi:DNA-binding MarR family transcriptional regulator